MAWSCDAVTTTRGDTVDLSKLTGAHEASMEMETPPTKNTARARFDLCGKIPKEDGVSDDDQVSPNPAR